MYNRKWNEWLSLVPLHIIKVSQGETGTLSCISGFLGNQATMQAAS